MTLFMKILSKIVPILVAGFFLVFFTVFGTLMGAFSGWIVGWFFADTILDFFSYGFGPTYNLSMWETGAALGFISGFLRVRVKGDGFFTTALKEWMVKQREPKVPPLPPTAKPPTLVRG